MAAGGQILAATHQAVRAAVKPGVTTMELDQIAEDFIRSHDGATPSFKGLYGFPASICASINEEIVHGIPSPKRVLKEGDVISVDIGVFYGGMHTDSANTWRVGAIDEKSAKLLRVTKDALEAGLAAAVVGNHVGDIGNAIETVVLKGGFAVVRELVGHGVGQLDARGAAGAEPRQAEARDEAGARTHAGDRADGECGIAEHAHAR